MYKKTGLFLVFFSAILFTFLFYRQSPGLNLLIYEFVFLGWLAISRQFELKNQNQFIYSAGLILSAIFTVITHSVFSYFMNFLSLFLFIGINIYPDMKSILNTFQLSFSSLTLSQTSFLNRISGSKFNGKKPFSYLKKSAIFLIPLLIIIVFVTIYRLSNPVFDKFAGQVNDFCLRLFDIVFRDLEFALVFTFIVGVFLGNFFLLRAYSRKVIEADIASSDLLARTKRNYRIPFKTNALSNELKAGVFLLCILNIILLAVNVIDINWVWFNFQWEGQYLKQFVHEGTYLLILSIIISIVIVLYYFRANLNYLRNNRILKQLSYLWLVQNAILTVSVAIRNFYYIQHFALAYKRIGVIVFLLLTIYGLFTVFVKVKERKSSFYLFRKNSFALYIILLICSFINWDNLIARYNFAHAESSFLHLDYMATLSDKSLPYLDKPLSELQRIDTIQKTKFPYEQKYLSPEGYYRIIERRKLAFIKNWESKGILGWNWAEYKAYHELKE